MFIITLPNLNLCFFFENKNFNSKTVMLDCLCCFQSKTGLSGISFDKLAAALTQQACAKLLTSLLQLQVCGQQLCYSIVRTTLLHDSQQIATSLLEQAVTSIANTTCRQVVGTTLLQVCCKFVTKFRLFTCVVDTAGSSKTFNLRV